MSGLYSRIHQEAEKLQKWKAAVVSDLKQKVCNMLVLYTLLSWLIVL